MKSYIVLVVAIFLIMSGCTVNVDLDAEKANVQTVVDNMEKAFEANDAELLASVFSKSQDNVFFGTDATERWIGFDSFINAQKQFFNSVEKGSTITFNNVVVDVSRLADAAWVSCVMNWDGVGQGEPFSIKGVRMTLVLQKQNTEWLIYHIHGSVPVSGQMIEY